MGSGVSHDYSNRKPIALIDLDGTLMPTDRILDHLVSTALDAMTKHGVSASQEILPGALKRAKDKLRENNKFFLYSGNAKDRKLFLRELLSECKISVPEKDLSQALNAGVKAFSSALKRSEVIRPFAGYREIIEDMLSKGVKIYVVTAGRRREQIAKVTAIGLHDLIPPERVLVSQGNYSKGKAKNPAFYAKVIAAVHEKPENPATILNKLRSPKALAKKHLANNLTTVYMIGDHPVIDVKNFLSLAEKGTASLRSIRIKRGKWKERIPASEEHLAAENLNHVRLMIFSNHGIQGEVFPHGLELSRK